MKVKILLVLAVLGVLLFTGMCVAAEFTADAVTTTKWSDKMPGAPANPKAPKMHSLKMQPMVEKAKVYVKGSLMRQEETRHGYTMITIVRKDKGVTWLLNPKAKQYHEIKPIKPLWDRMGIAQFGKSKKLGTAKVNGYLCDKVQYSSKMGDTCTAYVSQKLGYPIKVVTSMHKGVLTDTMECKNIKNTKPSDSLFQLPKGYKKVNTLVFKGKNNSTSTYGSQPGFKHFPPHKMPKPGTKPPSKNK